MDSIPIEVLQTVNPHLVLCKKADLAFASESTLEVIGLYGIIPAGLALDMVQESMKLRRLSAWTPGATLKISEVFVDAENIMFKPVHIDKRTSIFNNKVHKYGEIIITQSNGKAKRLSKILINAKLAVYDKERFHSRLDTGKLDTKLDTNELEQVLECIDKYNEKKEIQNKLQKYEKVLYCARQEEAEDQKTQNKDSALTVENLNRHNEFLCKDNEYLFKEIDMKPLGRANSRKKSEANSSPASKVTETDTSSYLQKKLDYIKSFPLVPVKKTLDGQTRLPPEECYESPGKIDKPKHTEVTSAKFKALKKFIDLKAPLPKIDSPSKEPNMVPRSVSEMKNTPTSQVQKEEKSQEKPKIQTVASDYKISKKSPKLMYNPETEKRVAFGPPEINKSLLHTKVLPQQVFEDVTYTKPVDDDDMKEAIPENPQRSDFGDVDSNVGFDTSAVKTAAVAVKKHVKPTQDIWNTPTKDVASVPTSSDKDKKCSSFGDRTPLKPVQDQESDSDGESLAEIVKKLTAEYGDLQVSPKLESLKQQVDDKKNYVNPFLNIDTNFSRFVDKLVAPVLMVHSAMNVRIEPSFLMSDQCFNDHILMKLKNMGVEKPMTIQTVSWCCVLRGYSLLMISPKSSGKTLGYVPAVCSLLSANDTLLDIECKGPMCVIVCATAVAVAEVEKLARNLSGDKKICALYIGMTDLDLTTNLFNGCDLLVCTPSILLRLLQSKDFGIDLRQLSTFVLDDCERLSEVYAKEIVYFQKKIKQMLKNRVAKEVQVQYIVVSRVWCDFMEDLCKIAPNPVVCIGAFQECVLYSRANTTVSFVTKQNKDNYVLEFLKEIKPCKKTVIVCRDDKEVENLQKILTKEKYNVLACNNTMDLQELYDLSGSLKKYQDSVSGLLFICCDGNLEHLNITDANYLVHYSMPTLFSMFCKRFSVLNENYASIFKEDNEDLKIKILIEESNIEQLPKILYFIKRCTTTVPEVLNEICEKAMTAKDEAKAQKLVPVCNNLLALGLCPDFWNCRERHVLIKEHDEPKNWMPTSGEITFKILHYKDAIFYSARLLTNVINGQETKYPQTHGKLALNMAMYFAKESNRKPHGIPKVGDICAVAVGNNFFSRCQVVEILSYYQRGNPNSVLIKLIDDEQLERSRDINLYHLPEHMVEVETHTIQVRLAGVKPKDKDITFSKLACSHLEAITSSDEEMYLKGHVALTVGNCVLVDTLETCKDLKFSGTVIKHDLKHELLNRFATLNPEHIPSLEKLSWAADILTESENQQQSIVKQPVKELPEVRWAFLDTDELSLTVFTTAIDPETFFVRLAKFEDLMFGLCQDIQTYVGENPEPISHVRKDDIVLAKLPDDGIYERARVDEIIGENKVRCFFVDQGDWRDLATTDLAPITDKFVSRLPFQAIECRLFGVRPPGEHWTDFSNIWFTNNLEFADGTKQLYIKTFTKESAQFTGGYKYGVVLIDTNSGVDVIINQAMVDSNMARENVGEMEMIQQMDLNCGTKVVSEEGNDDDWEKIQPDSPSEEQVVNDEPDKDPYAFSDDSMSSGGWSCNLNEDFKSLIQPNTSGKMKIMDYESDSKSISVIDSPAPSLDLEKDNHIPVISSPKSFKQATETPEHKAVSSQSSSSVSIPITKYANKNTEDADDKSVLSSVSSQILHPSKSNKSLDSDDLTSPEPSQSQIIKELEPVSTKLINNRQIIKELEPVSTKLINNRQIITELEPVSTKLINNSQIEELRKPKLGWRQNGNKIFVKILIITDDYDLTIKEKSLKFNCTANDTNYGFDFELYGVVDVDNSKHENKGQYILVSLTTVLSRNWLSLTKEVGLKKWIVYDVDSLDVSSDEESDPPLIAPQISGLQPDSESDDDDFGGDVNF